MCDVELVCSRRQVRKQFENALPLTTSTSEDKDEDSEKDDIGVEEDCRDSHFESPRSLVIVAILVNKCVLVLIIILYQKSTWMIMIHHQSKPPKQKRYKRMTTRLVKCSHVHKYLFV